jgi:hypothetical protein
MMAKKWVHLHRRTAAWESDVLVIKLSGLAVASLLLVSRTEHAAAEVPLRGAVRELRRKGISGGPLSAPHSKGLPSEQDYFEIADPEWLPVPFTVSRSKERSFTIPTFRST